MTQGAVLGTPDGDDAEPAVAHRNAHPVVAGGLLLLQPVEFRERQLDRDVRTLAVLAETVLGQALGEGIVDGLADAYLLGFRAELEVLCRFDLRPEEDNRLLPP